MLGMLAGALSSVAGWAGSAISGITSAVGSLLSNPAAQAAGSTAINAAIKSFTPGDGGGGSSGAGGSSGTGGSGSSGKVGGKGDDDKKDNTMLYIAIGGAVLVAVILLLKK